MAASPSVPTLYRSVLRQFVKNSIHPRANRSPSIQKHLRLFFEAQRKALTAAAPASQQQAKEQEASFVKLVDDWVVFQKAHRLHKELVERYNPTHGLTQSERASMSAKLVGLQMPKEVTEETIARDRATDAAEALAKETAESAAAR